MRQPFRQPDRAQGWAGLEAADPHRPFVPVGLSRLPLEAPWVVCLDLVAEGLGLVIVDQHQLFTRGQLVQESENAWVSLWPRQGTHIQKQGSGGHVILSSSDW